MTNETQKGQVCWKNEYISVKWPATNQQQVMQMG